MGNEQIPDYTNIRFSMADMQRFFKDQGIKLDQNSTQNLNSVFNHFDAKKEKKDGEISNIDNRANFLKAMQISDPKTFDKLVEFSIIVENAEDMRKIQQETEKETKKNFKG